MIRLACTERRYEALRQVHQGQVCYQTGLAAPATGYAWSQHPDATMVDGTRQALKELWAAGLVEVDTHRLFDHRGHRVTISMSGYRLLREWETTSSPSQQPLQAAA